MTAGIGTASLSPATLVDDLIGNRDGATKRVSLDALGRQLLDQTPLADATMSYAAGAQQVAAGDVVSVPSRAFGYEVMASGASGWDAATAGGVRLRAIPLAGRHDLAAFGGMADLVLSGTGTRASGTDNLAVISRMIAAMARDKVPGRIGPGQ